MKQEDEGAEGIGGSGLDPGLRATVLVTCFFFFAANGLPAIFISRPCCIFLMLAPVYLLFIGKGSFSQCFLFDSKCDFFWDRVSILFVSWYVAEHVKNGAEKYHPNNNDDDTTM